RPTTPTSTTCSPGCACPIPRSSPGATRTRSRAVNSSGSPSRWRSRPDPVSSCSTNRRPRSTSSPRRPCSRSSTTCAPSSTWRCSSSATTSASSPRSPMTSSSCAGGRRWSGAPRRTCSRRRRSSTPRTPHGRPARGRRGRRAALDAGRRRAPAGRGGDSLPPGAPARRLGIDARRAPLGNRCPGRGVRFGEIHRRHRARGSHRDRTGPDAPARRRRRGTRPRPPRRQPPAERAPQRADGVPERRPRPQPPPHGGGRDRPAAEGLRSHGPRARARAGSPAVARRGRPRPGIQQAAPGATLRRATPAGGDRPRPRRAPEPPHRRRTHDGAGRLGAGRRARPPRSPARTPRARVPVHQPRPRGRPPPRAPHRRHALGRHRRDGAGGGTLRPPATPLHPDTARIRRRTRPRAPARRGDRRPAGPGRSLRSATERGGAALRARGGGNRLMSKVRVEEWWIPMPDGTRLRARAWRPAQIPEGGAPALLEYLPYRLDDWTWVRDSERHPYYAAHGYVSVRVDIRGTGSSQGHFIDEYSEVELDDGIEVINWLARQPWSNGRVGMFGISWGGFNSLQLAARAPEPLKAIVTVCSADDRYDNDVHYIGGALLGIDMSAWAGTMLAFASRPPRPEVVGADWVEQWSDRLEHLEPLGPRWLAHQERDDYWRR